MILGPISSSPRTNTPLSEGLEPSSRLPTKSTETFNEEKYARYEARLNRYLHAPLDRHRFLVNLQDHSTSNVYIFGGTMRRFFMGCKEYGGDLDLVIPDGCNDVLSLLDSMARRLPASSMGTRRYRWGKLGVDIYRPSEFLGLGVTSVYDMLRETDLVINSIAYNIRTGGFLDPHRVLGSLVGRLSSRSIAGFLINREFWMKTNSNNLITISVRLLRLLREHSDVLLSKADVDFLVEKILPRLCASDAEWDSSSLWFFPEGKACFVECFRQSLLSQSDKRPPREKRKCKIRWRRYRRARHSLSQQLLFEAEE